MTTLVKGDILSATGTANQFGVLPAGTNGQSIVYDNTTATGLKTSNVIGTMTNAQSLYVEKNGNDSTGNGSPQFPYLTITAAVTAAVALSPTITKRIAIHIGAGQWSDSVNLPANISIVGISQLGTNLTGAWTINSASWAAGDNRGSFEMLRITGTISLDFTFSASNEGKMYFYDVRLPTSGLVVTCVDSALNQLEFIGCHFFGIATFNGGTSNLIGSQVGGAVTINDTATATATVNLRNSTAAAITATRAFGGVALGFLGSSEAGTLTTTGAVAITTDQLPPVASTSLSGTTTITYANGSRGLGYTPVAGANWVNPDPTNVQDALDRIAAVVSVGGVTPIP